MARLNLGLDVFTEEQDAVNSFFPDRAIRHFDVLEFVREQNAQRYADAGTPHGDAPHD